MNVMYQDNSKNINLEDIRQILKVISDLISKPSRYMLNKFKSNPNNQYINKEYRKNETKKDETMRLYIKSLETAYKIFGRFAFRKMPDQEKRRPVNKALFEAWTVKFAQCTEREQEILVMNRSSLVNDFMKLCREDKEFDDALKSAKVGAVKKRFERIDGLIEEVLKSDRAN